MPPSKRRRGNQNHHEPRVVSPGCQPEDDVPKRRTKGRASAKSAPIVSRMHRPAASSHGAMDTNPGGDRAKACIPNPGQLVSSSKQIPLKGVVPKVSSSVLLCYNKGFLVDDRKCGHMPLTPYVNMVLAKLPAESIASHVITCNIHPPTRTHYVFLQAYKRCGCSMTQLRVSSKAEARGCFIAR